MKYCFGPLMVCALAAAPYNVRDYGAKGDGKTKDTASLQAAIDAAAKAGGAVVVPPGKYLSGTLHLKSDISLELSAGATLAASPDEGDFDKYESLPFQPVDDRETTYFRYALLTGDGVRNVAIRGPGLIDGNRPKRGGPKPIALKNCERVSIRDLTVRDAPNYAISLLGCADVDVDGVSVLNGYSDGIDPDCSRFVRISNCYIDAYDDAICLKSSQALGRPVATEHVTVTNCVLRTNCNHVKMGTESRGGFRNIAVSNCTLLRRETGRPPISGVAIESVDGAAIDGVTIANITMRDASAPVFIRLGNRGRGLNPPAPGSIQNVILSNIAATGGAMTSSITGLAGFPVRNVSLSDLNFTMAGGDDFAGLEVSEVPAKYPEATMFGPLPAHSLYARHVEGLTLRNFKTRWTSRDLRPALVFDDVRELELHGFRSDTADGPQPVIWLHQTDGALLTACRVHREIPLFLRVTGANAKHVSVIGNDLRLPKKIVEVTAGAEHSSVALTGNLTPGRMPVID